MSFPIHDWQFWVVTLIALAAAWYLVRKFIPSRMLPRILRPRKKGKSVSLTISAGDGKGKP